MFPPPRHHIYPALLFLYGLPLIIVSVLRLAQLAGASITLPDTERILSGNLVPLIAHIVCVIGFNTFGVLQFHARLRHAWPQIHRRIGWAALLCGFCVALSGLWLSLSFHPADYVTSLLTTFRALASVLLATFLTLGLRAVLCRDFHIHRCWMIRAYALALGTTTQGLLMAMWEATLGPLPDAMHAVAFAMGWGLTLATAEFFFVNRHRSLAPMKGTFDAQQM